ncbi:GlcG/HbpS family heme-binding protein [Psychrobacter sp. I-STPA10]|uniref:GlcG/HbpS family heme-binding protein n=1 Tax=Psychrobacter sp. I-STPA10 TaxID=2585769 RepID=UPI001E3C0A5E|nr:heme-binding protein [Psychrobacter sp. I-STPA10]
MHILKSLFSNKLLLTSGLLMTAIAAQAAPSAQIIQATVDSRSISSDAAVQVAQQAVAQCKADGYAVTATVVDAAGTPLVQIRDDKAGPHTLSSSYRKAFTAVSLKKPTADYADMIAQNPKIDALRDMDERLLFLGGGVPIIINNTIIGGIGVGGAPGAHLDVECANAGAGIFQQ